MIEITHETMQWLENAEYHNPKHVKEISAFIRKHSDPSMVLVPKYEKIDGSMGDFEATKGE